MRSISFYKHFAGNPFFNMAFDEWLFARACDLPGAVMLRLYSWEPGAITFGFNQKEETAVDRSLLGETPLIRRITGGRALYHDPSELTYAIGVNTGSNHWPQLEGSISHTSAEIAGVLVGFLKRLGIESDFVRGSQPEQARPEYFHKAPCFDSTARAEVVAGSQKIVASAQRRIRDTFFQHGSIKLSGIAQHPALRLSEGTVSGAESMNPLGYDEFERMARLFSAEFARYFECDAELCALSNADDASVAARLSYVRKNNRNRRDVIEQ